MAFLFRMLKVQISILDLSGFSCFS